MIQLNRRRWHCCFELCSQMERNDIQFTKLARCLSSCQLFSLEKRKKKQSPVSGVLNLHGLLYGFRYN